MEKVKTRFAPSPTGYLHVGGARTALFNYVLAKQAGGTFLLRIEDTDRRRHDETAIARIIEDLRWLGLQPDEGIEVGGPNGPYRQSERLAIYRKYVDQLLQAGRAYHAFETPEELEAMRKAAQAEKGGFFYPRPDPLPTATDAERVRAEGQPVVVRFLCPGKDVTVHDEAFGDVTMPAKEMADFVILKADGYPTYHLAVVVDDVLMDVSYICRGQEFLGQTWRHVLLREALGFGEPRYCHLPLITDMKGRKLSKREGEEVSKRDTGRLEPLVEVHAFRVAGYLPEALVNFLALLGWRPSGDREKLTMDELIELFGPERIGKTNARFDRDKLLAFNTDAVATASDGRLLEAFKDYLALNDTLIPAGDEELLRRLIRANKGFRTFADIPAKCNVLFEADDAYGYDEKAVKKVLRKSDGAGFTVLTGLRRLLAASEWTHQALEALVNDYCQTHKLSLGKVAQPIRVAVTGTTISPSIYETLLILGREKTLARIDRCLKIRE